jgi:hypothetical protein
MGSTLAWVLQIAPGIGLLARILGNYPRGTPPKGHLLQLACPRIQMGPLKGPPQSPLAVPANTHDKQVRGSFWGTLVQGRTYPMPRQLPTSKPRHTPSKHRRYSKKE